MSANLKSWVESRWLKSHRSSPAEVATLLAAVDDDLANAKKDLSPAWRFNIAYSGALGAATVLLAAAGYRAERDNKHYRTLAAIPLILGSGSRELAGFLDRCRTMRHDVTYEGVRSISAAEADELIQAVEELRNKAATWIRKHRPDLLRS
jgi:hypothetical protein